MNTDQIRRNLELLTHELHDSRFSTKAARGLYDILHVFDDIEQAKGRKAAIHPSALARCARMAFMELEDIPRLNLDVPTNVRRAGRVGRVLHGLIQNAFERVARDSGVFQFEAEVPLTNHPEVRRLCLAGNSDGVLRYEKAKVGLEIKGVGAEEFSTLGSGAREKDLLQASVYQVGLDLDAVWFLYINRRSWVERHVVVRIPDEYWNTMKTRAESIIQCRLRDEAPPGVEDAYVCDACAYEPACPHPRTRSVGIKEILQCAANVQSRRR